MKVFAFLFVAIAGGLGLGWLLTPPEDVGPGERVRAPAGLAEVKHGGEALGASARRLAALGLDMPEAAPEPETGEPSEPPTDPAPSEDIARAFRRDLTAIEQTASGPVAWIIDLNASHGRRALAKGEEYADGWRVASLDGQTIELRRGGDARRIVVFELPPDP